MSRAAADSLLQPSHYPFVEAQEGPGMQTTSVVVGGKGTNAKTALYVGGLEESVTEATLHSTFIPFGEIKDVSVPLDNTTGVQLRRGPTVDHCLLYPTNSVLGNRFLPLNWYHQYPEIPVLQTT